MSINSIEIQGKIMWWPKIQESNCTRKETAGTPKNSKCKIMKHVRTLFRLHTRMR